jgi:hypothetical protein
LILVNFVQLAWTTGGGSDGGAHACLKLEGGGAEGGGGSHAVPTEASLRGGGGPTPCGGRRRGTDMWRVWRGEEGTGGQQRPGVVGRVAVGRIRDHAQGVRLEREEVAPGLCFLVMGQPAWAELKSIVTFSNYLK